ncbi:GspH/FimT family protein [Inquilinus limosus]|uniref:GspH/FimT family protein n=1 Tax=Inquilinus limosus TaxID=171674 RepID=UPI003F15DD75
MTPTSPAGDRARRRDCRGFTLLELLVVLVVLATAAALVPPILARGSAQASLKRTVATLASELRQARSDAILRDGPQGVVIDPIGRSFGPLGAPLRHRIGDGIAVDVTSAAIAADRDGRPGIRFLPDGRSTGGTVRLAGQGRTYRVEVNWLTGRVRVQEADDGGA